MSFESKLRSKKSFTDSETNKVLSIEEDLKGKAEIAVKNFLYSCDYWAGQNENTCWLFAGANYHNLSNLHEIYYISNLEHITGLYEYNRISPDYKDAFIKMINEELENEEVANSSVYLTTLYLKNVIKDVDGKETTKVVPVDAITISTFW